MREALLAALCAALVTAAAPAGASSDRLAAVEDALDALGRGELQFRSRVLEFGAAAPAERAASAAEARVVLEAARDALIATPQAVGEPPALVRDVGFGVQTEPSPEQCVPVETRLLIFSSDFIEPVTTYRVGITAVPYALCTGSVGPYAEVLLDARLALATCGTCATARADHWLHAPDGSAHVNDFAQAHHRGHGHAKESTLCWAFFCTTHATFKGAAATVELLAEPVDLPVPPLRVP